MTFSLPHLPYAENSLEPYMSAQTFSFHYKKHHQAYVTNLNNFLPNSGLEGKSLEDIISATKGDSAKAAIFNNAAQVWNHTFFWHSMCPNGGGKPAGKLLDTINNSFGSYDDFVKEFKQAAISQFGSGWAWLVVEDDKLKITKTANADTPIAHGQTPLLTCDVWEHAYYLDFQNRRPDYVQTYLDHLVNWVWAEKQLG